MRCSVFIAGLAVSMGVLAPATVARAQYPFVQNLTPRQREDLAAAISEYADDGVVDAHARAIDIYRPGHGEWFLRETRSATRALNEFLTRRGIVLAAWDPQTPIPGELAIVRPDAIGGPRPPLVNLDPRMPVSRYLPP